MPKCGEFLYIKKEAMFWHGFYQVSKECLSEDCDYKESISNSFNEAMGLKEPKSSLDRINEIRDKTAPYNLEKKVKELKIPNHYYNIDDTINHTIKCPFCDSMNEFDTQFSIEQQSLIHKCLVCGAEFILKDMDFQTGIGTMEVIKGGRPQPDPDLQTKF